MLSSQFSGLTLLIVIPPLLHTHLSPHHEVYLHRPDQATHYQTLGPKHGPYLWPGAWLVCG
jgi:hypothetical protein